ncbi:MAG: DUF805 domain-containing protein [Gammaproteobacteria bacterium]|nr:DUF805 domain-containing protein [Gammaproteobacteria bacterium]
MHDSSPYQPPRSPITSTASEPFAEIKLFSTQGRLGRVRYIGYLVGLIVLIFLSAGLIASVNSFSRLQEGGGDGDLVHILGSGALIALWIVTIVVSILLIIQRLHDFNASSWWSLLVLVPLANLVLYLILLIMPGTQGANRFGNPPPPNTLGVILLALILPLITVTGIIAAIAIPAYMDYAAHTQQTAPNRLPLQTK